MVEFFENSLPELVVSVLSLIGTVAIVATLNTSVFVACAVTAAATTVLYALTGRLTIRYNQGLNDEHEQQVDGVHSSDPRHLGAHPLPLYFQGWLRLREISGRLARVGGPL